MESCGNRRFDFSCADSPGSEYFKSSFARSMTFDYLKQSKSLDYAYLDRCVIREESDELDMYPSGPHSLTTAISDRHFTSQETEDNIKSKMFRPFVKLLHQNKAQTKEHPKIWKTKQVSHFCYRSVWEWFNCNSLKKGHNIHYINYCIFFDMPYG